MGCLRAVRIKRAIEYGYLFVLIQYKNGGNFGFSITVAETKLFGY